MSGGGMPEFVHYGLRDRVAILTLDNPPVNALGEGVWEALVDGVRRAGADHGADAIVLIGAGHTFIAGADLNAFTRLRTRDVALAHSERMHALLLEVEDAAKPLVAAIHGNALGGGLEVAMCCHYRVAAKDARVGQPEVTLGLIPGAGGTQRLPRLVGAALALTMCTEGGPVPAPAAADARLVDLVVEGDAARLLDEAIRFARALAAAGGRRRTRDIEMSRETRAEGIEACRAVRARLAASLKGSKAPLAAVDAIEACFTLTFDQGSARERERFVDCLLSIESKALRHLFFAEREAAKVPGVSKATPVGSIRRAAVVGAGTMGGGIAMAYANADIPVLLNDVSDVALAHGMATIRKHYESTVAKGRLSREERDRRLALITPTSSYDAFGTVDIVVEAVFEDLALKEATFAELGRVTPPACVLASNTSTLDIDALARASGRAPLVVGHHFFSPASVMTLVEIVRGRETSLETLATSIALGKRLGKVPVVVGNCFGFVANRMLGYYLREAALLLEEGATVPQIDGALIDFGLPVGPFGMEDIAGLDIGARIRQHLRAAGRTWADGPQSTLSDQLFMMGRYGQKTGAGWYTYEPGSRTRVPDPLIDRLAAEAAALRGIARRPVADSEIVDRTMTALVNEGARVLEEGYARRAGDIDVVYCHGFGFPRHRGGPLFYADTVGLPVVLARLRAYASRYGDYWRPAPLIERLAAEGRGFYTGD
jgi:3-hydroxyacyl-CoA dehydrogenase